MHDSTLKPAEAIPASAQMEHLLAECDGILLDTQLDAETKAVRAGEPRVDEKAGNLLQLCSGLLLAGLALLAAGKLPGLAAVAGWSAAGLLGGAVVLLSSAIRPNLNGDFGFVRWARLATDEELIAALISDDACSRRGRVRRLRWLSRAQRTKFRRVRTAHTLLVAAVAVAAIAAGLTALGR